MEKLTQDLDGKENYVSSLVSILKDIGWIKLEPSGKYIITDKGETEAQKYWHNKDPYQILLTLYSNIPIQAALESFGWIWISNRNH